MLTGQFAQALLKLGSARLRRLEILVQEAQGKGWGAFTVEQEVGAVHELLGAAAAEELVVLDVGANVGDWTLQALEQLPHARIYAFEPSEAAFRGLVSAVGASPRVSVSQVALGDTDQEAVLYADSPGSGLASLARRRLDHAGISFAHEERVVVRTLESWARSVTLDKVDVLKLDVEGCELAVLRGAGDFLRDVRVIQFEFGGCNIDTRTYFQDFWYLLSDDFEIFRLSPTGLDLLPAYTERDETFTTTNFFARRRST